MVDEQHRFGVNQRRALDRKAPAGLAPHVLHMTATPIPRTLALTAYGDLDVTVLRELPAGRRPIDTLRGRRPSASARGPTSASARSCAPAARRSSSARWSRSPRRCRRAPRPPSSSACAASELQDFRVVLLHGQMRPREKQEAMAAFAAGGADVLVATTVIEVGIDVPNATVMLVEDAERYGISQLHQLRGRIGRGEHESVCLLFGPKESRAAARARRAPRRLQAGRDRPRAARRGGDARHAPVRARRSSASPGCPRTPSCSSARRMRARALLDADPELRAPEHALLEDAVQAAYGADALEPIPA